jgi:hypothetical protein
MIYQLQQGFDGNNHGIGISGKAMSIPFAPGNTDYMAFKQALTTGKNADGTAVELQDATGTVMTSAQITTFLETLP